MEIFAKKNLASLENSYTHITQNLIKVKGCEQTYPWLPPNIRATNIKGFTVMYLNGNKNAENFQTI